MGAAALLGGEVEADPDEGGVQEKMTKARARVKIKIFLIAYFPLFSWDPVQSFIFIAERVQIGDGLAGVIAPDSFAKYRGYGNHLQAWLALFHRDRDGVGGNNFGNLWDRGQALQGITGEQAVGADHRDILNAVIDQKIA
jgi:hypothetical protein